jgi:hypothetical protein
MVLFGLLMDHRNIGRGDILLDAILYGGLMTALGVYENRRGRQPLAAGASNGVGQPPREHLLLVGDTSILGGYISTLTTLQEHHYVITGLVTPHHAERTNTLGGYPILGEVADLRPILEQLDVDKVVVLTEGLQAGQLETVRSEAGRRACPCVEVDLTSKVRLPSVPA